MKQGTGISERGSGKSPTRVSRILLMLAFPALGASFLAAQSPTRPLVKPADVEYLFPEQVTVLAGQSNKVVLHFRVGEGLHINSNKPREEFLIPTTFSIPDSSGVHLDGVIYPAGSDLTLPFDPTNKLSVYTGEFALDTHIVAAKGDHLVEAKLHYQACNNSICLPPRTITVPIDVVGK
jgi:hypothetical protein